jgi:hypothetical protein
MLAASGNARYGAARKIAYFQMIVIKDFRLR